MELVDCHPFFRCDNYVINNDIITLLDFNKNGNSIYGTGRKKDYISFGSYKNKDEKIKYSYSPLVGNIDIQDIINVNDEEYVKNKKDIERSFSALIFIIKQEENMHFFLRKIFFTEERAKEYFLGMNQENLQKMMGERLVRNEENDF